MQKIYTSWKATIILTIPLIISGCAGLNVAKKPEYGSTGVDGKNYSTEFVFKDPFGKEKPSKKEIKGKIRNRFENNSKYVKKRSEYGETINDVYGVVVYKKDDVFRLEYVNGDDNCGYCPDGESLTKTQYDFPFALKETATGYEMSIEFPSEYKHIPHTDAVGITHSPFISFSKMNDDAANIFESLKHPIRFEKAKVFKGEINSQYSDESVYANFERILGHYSWKSSKARQDSGFKTENTFALEIDGERYPVHVEVFPYRDGSKVSYQAKMKYEVTSDGSSSLRSDSENIVRNKIKNVISD